MTAAGSPALLTLLPGDWFAGKELSLSFSVLQVCFGVLLRGFSDAGTTLRTVGLAVADFAGVGMSSAGSGCSSSSGVGCRIPRWRFG